MAHDRPTYIASCSFGKDSIATILLAMLHHEPLDRIVSVEAMFDNARGISGEHPEHIQWVKEVAIPRLKELTGIDTDLIRNEKDDYVKQFYHIRKGTKDHPERDGMYQGYPLASLCIARSELKLRPLEDYFKQYPNCIQYVGIAADEPNRLARLDGVKKVSLLAKYGYIEKMAFDLCAEYGLLSPIYQSLNRGGCWFCPNQKIKGFCQLRDKHPELWNELKQLSKVKGTISNCFCYDKTFDQVEKQMDFYKRQTTLIFDN